MDYSLLLPFLLLGLLALAAGLPCWWLVRHYRNRPSRAGILDAWLAATSGAQAKRYRFWFRYGRHGSRSRRVWAVGFRKFQRRFRATIPDLAIEHEAVFLMACWRTLVRIHRFKRAHRSARKLAYGV